MTAIAVIPARYASTRLPGKPLLRDTGKYLIQHVCERISQARSLQGMIVATDDERIAEAVRGFGGRAAMTRADHVSGTDRVAEVAAGLDADLIVNVQGDEPEIEPAAIDQLVGLLAAEPQVSMATLACPFAPTEDPANPNKVKVVLDRQGRALYFSRALVPYPRDTQGRPTEALGSGWYLHLGIYAYRRDFLLRLAKMPPTPLEECERLEQLRVLENGFEIAVGIVPQAASGIDTPEDYAAFVRRLKGG